MALTRIVSLAVDSGNSVSKLKEIERLFKSSDNAISSLKKNALSIPAAFDKSTTATQNRIRALKNTIDSISKDVKINIGVNQAQSNKAIADLKRSLDKISDKQVSLNVNNKAAIDRIKSISQELGSLGNKKVDLKVNIGGSVNSINKLKSSVSELSSALKAAKNDANALSKAVQSFSSGNNFKSVASDVKGLDNAVEGLNASLKSTGSATVNVSSGNNRIRSVSTELNRVSKSANTATAEIDLLTSAFGGLAAGFGIAGVVTLADTYTQLNNRLKLVTDTTEELAIAQQQVAEISRETSSPLLATADLYSKIGRNADALSLSQQDVARTTETVTKAIAISGQGVQQAEAAVLQLGQALSSGRLQGDELRSLSENAAPLAQIIADFVPAAEGSIGKLREFASTGKVTSEIVIQAITAGAASIDAQFTNIDFTIRQSLNNANNAAVRFVGAFSQLNGGSGGGSISGGINAIADAIDFLGNNIETVAAVLTGVGIVALGRLTGALAVASASTIKLAIEDKKLADTEIILAQNTLKVAQAEKAALVAERERIASNIALANAEKNRASIGVGLTGDLQKRNKLDKEAIQNANSINRTTQAIADAQKSLKEQAGKANIAVGALNSGLALLGGPVGAAITAAAGIYYYVDSLESAEERTARLAQESADLEKRLKSLQVVGINGQLGALEEYEQVLNKAADAQAELDKLLDFQRRGGVTSASEIARLRAEIDGYEEQLNNIDRALISAVGRQDDYGESLLKTAGLTSDQLKFIDRYADKLTKVDDAVATSKDAIDKLTSALSDNNKNEEILNKRKEESEKRIKNLRSQLVGVTIDTENLTATERLNQAAANANIEITAEQAAKNKELITQIERERISLEGTEAQLKRNSNEQKAFAEQLDNANKALTQSEQDRIKSIQNKASAGERLAKAEADRSAKALEAIRILQSEKEVTEESERALFIYNKTKRAIALVEASSLPGKLELIDKIMAEGAALADIDKKQKEDKKNKREAQKIIKASTTEYEKYRVEIDKINKLLSAGFLTDDQASMAIKKLTEDLKDSKSEITGLFDSLSLSFDVDLSPFSDIVSSLDDVTKASERYAEVLSKTEAFPGEHAEATKDMAKASVDGWASVLGSSKEFFDESSDGYKALEAAEKAFRLVQLAESAQVLVSQISGFSELITASTAATGVMIANEGAKSSAAAATAVATAAQSSPWTGFATAAAMAALLAGFGIAIGGGGGSSVNVSQQRQESQGRGTVFGDAGEQSESIANSVELMTDLQSELIGVNKGMLASLQSLSANITSGGQLIIRQTEMQPINVEGLGTSLSSTGQLAVSIFENTVGGMIDSILGDGALGGITEKIAGGLFGKTTKNIVDKGVILASQNVEDIIATGIADVFSFVTVETKKKSWFKSSTTYDDVKGELDNATLGQFGLIITDVYDSISSAITSIFGDQSEEQSRLLSASIEEQFVSLKDLTGEEQLAELQAVFSNIADTLSTTAIPNLVEFANVGEGGLETLARLSAQVEILDQAALMVGTSITATGQELILLSEAAADSVGGVKNLAENVTFFAENFLSEEEKLNLTFKALSKSFNVLSDDFDGFSSEVPKTTDEFRALVSSVDITTESGAALFSRLVELSPEVLKFTENLNDLNEELKKGFQESATFIFSEFFDSATQQSFALDMASRSIVEYNKEIGLTGEAYIDSREDLVNYINALDKNTTAGRKAISELRPLADAILALEEAAGGANDTINRTITTDVGEITVDLIDVSAIQNQLNSARGRLSEIPDLISDAELSLTSLTALLSATGDEEYSTRIQEVEDNISNLTEEMQGLPTTISQLETSLADANTENQNAINEAKELEKQRKDEAEATKNLTDIVALQIRLLQAQGDEEGALVLIRQKELDATNAEGDAILEQIFAQEDLNRARERQVELDRLNISLLRALGKEEEAIAEERRLQLDAARDDEKAILEQIFAAEDLADAREVYIDALQREQDELQNTADTFNDFARSLRQTARDLRIDEVLSGLSPEERLRELESQFTDVARRAQLGDQEALGELSGISQEYLDASRDYYGVSQGYFDDFDEVLGVLDNSADVADRQASIAESNLSVNRDILQQLGVIDSTVLTVSEALLQYINAGGVAPEGSRSISDVIADINATAIDGLIALPSGSTGLLSEDLPESFVNLVAGELGIPGFASGGINIQGPGTGTSDSIPAFISAGESVMTAKATTDNASTLAAMNAGADLPGAIENQTEVLAKQNSVLISEVSKMNRRLSRIEDDLNNTNNAA